MFMQQVMKQGQKKEMKSDEQSNETKEVEK